MLLEEMRKIWSWKKMSVSAGVWSPVFSPFYKAVRIHI